MKKWLSISLIVVFVTPLSAAPFNLDQLLQVADENRVDNIGQLLPLLPENLRSGFTLQYHGNGLQDASPLYPRVILFGDDAKFVMTFNGHPSQAMYNSLEIMQWNSEESLFELYALEFPLKRTADGSVVRPERNPQKCAACHGVPAHPIWGRYNFWAGMYGSHDDKLRDSFELSNFEKFMSSRNEHARYRSLLPREGSVYSPFSSATNENYSFRPNDNIGSFFARLNSLYVSQRAKQVLGFERFLLLMSPARNHCDRALTKDDRKKINTLLSTEFLKIGYTVAPHPELENMNPKNVVYLLNSTAAAWGMTPVTELQDPFFLDKALMTTTNYVTANLATEFFGAYPELQPIYRRQPTAYTLAIPRLVKTDLDRQIVRTFDSLVVPLAIVPNSTCETFLSVLRREFSL